MDSVTYAKSPDNESRAKLSILGDYPARYHDDINGIPGSTGRLGRFELVVYDLLTK